MDGGDGHECDFRKFVGCVGAVVVVSEEIENCGRGGQGCCSGGCV